MKNKIISIALVIVMMASILAPVSASFSGENESVGMPTSNVGKTAGSNAPSENFIYITNETAVTIIEYIGAGGNVVIPDTIEGMPVEVISDYAFSYKATLTSITIPDVVITIGNNAFQSCTALTAVTISSSVKIISDGTFRSCSALTSVTIPNGVESIGASAFRSCSALTSIIIPDSVESIGSNAFQSCSSLTAISIGDGVKTIGSSVFYRCTALVAVSVDAGNVKYASIDGVLYDKAVTKLMLYPASKTGSLTVPNTVTSIEALAFSDCAALTSVIIPSSVTEIGNNAFSGCTALTSVVIGSGVKTIGDSVFSGCTALRSVIVPNGVTTIGSQAFRDCTALTSVTIPDSVTTLGNNAFSGCTALTSVVIGRGVPVIDSNMFSGCTALIAINVDENNANYASFDGVLYSKDKTTLILCPLGKSSLVMPSTLKIISDSAFSGCIRLVHVQIPDSVESIGAYAFSGCTKLTSVTIGNGVTSIGASAFQGCSALTSVIIPSSVTILGSSAFYGCSALTTVTIGSGVTSITRDMFSGCTVLVAINVDAGNIAYASVDGVLYDNAVTKLMLCPTGKTGSLVVPNTVTSIEASAFSGCTALTSVVISDNVKTIGIYSFSGCTALASVTMGSGITSIENYAFQSCTALTSITIGSGVKTIGDWAFYQCTALTSVVIPNSVTSIGSSAFYGCSTLTSVTVGSSVTTIDSRAFSGCTALTAINVDESNANYASVNGVLYDKGVTKLILCPLGKSGSLILPGTLKTIDGNAFQGCARLVFVQIPNGVTSIGISAFSGCSALTSMALPNTVTEIGLSAFSGCSALTVVSLGDGLKDISKQAFSGCTALISIEIPDGVMTIDQEAFYGCSALTSVVIGNGVKSIGAYAFQDCKAMTSLTLGSKVDSIGYQAFLRCTALTEIIVDKNNVNYASSDNVLYNKTMGKLILFPGGRAGSFTVPEGVTSIGDFAFQDCTSLTSITIGSDVRNIGYSSFRGLSSLIALIFEGDAPSGSGWLYEFNSALVIYYYSGATGFSSPTWQGAPTSVIGSTPTAPNEFNVRAGDKQATLTWSEPSYTGDSDIDYYIVYQNGIDVKHVTETSATINGLTNGQIYEFKVAAHNDDGIGQVSYSSVVTPSMLTILSPSTPYINAGTVTMEWSFNGNLDDLDHFVIVIDDGEEITVSGSERSRLLEALSDGVHIVKITAFGSAGVIISNEVSFVVDTTSPTVVITSPAEEHVSSSSSVTVSWTAEDLSGIKTIEISTDGTTWTEVSGNNYEFTDLADGRHTVYVRVTDPAGNVEQDSISFVVDTVAPTVTDKSPTGTGASVSSTISITFSEVMNKTSVAFVINGVTGTVTWNGNTVVFTPSSSLAHGTEYTVTVTGKDLADNVMEETTWKFTTVEVDVDVPELGTVSGVIKDNDGNVVAGAKVTLKGATTKTATTDSNGKYVFNDVAIGEYTLTVEKEGFDTYTKTVKVTANNVVDGSVVDGTLSKSEGSEDIVLIVIGIVAIVVVAALGVLMFVRRKKGGMNGGGPEIGKETEAEEKKK